MSAHSSALLDDSPRPLEAFVREPGCSDGIDFHSLEVGTVVTVHTRYSCYRLVVVNPKDKCALVTGGELFPRSTEVRVEGATAGGTAIKAGWIGIGLRLEMWGPSNRVTTSVVRSIAIEPPPESMTC